MIHDPDKSVLELVTSTERVLLTQDELLMKGRRLAELIEQHQELKAHNKTIRAELREEEAEMHAEVLDIRLDVAMQAELREVPCEWVAHWAINEAYLIRIDTGELVRTRPITAEERQLRIVPLDGGQVAGPGLRNKRSRKGEPPEGPAVSDLDNDLPPVA